MTDDPTQTAVTVAEPGVEPEIGWRVLDSDGNVVDSGPLIRLEMATQMGDADGSD